MGLFGRPDIEVNISKKIIRINKIVDIEDILLGLKKFFDKNGMDIPVNRLIGAALDKIVLIDGWSFHPKTVELYKQKDNKRYKHIRASGQDYLQSNWKAI